MFRVFDNIILIPQPNCNYSTIAFLVAGGAAAETGDKTGVAHLLEHVICAEDPYGLEIEAETQLEYISFQVTQLAEKTAVNLKKLDDLLFHRDITQQNLVVQRERLQLELITSYQHATFQDVYGELFGERSAQYRGWSGSIIDVDSITLDDLREYKQRCFKHQAAVVVIAGRFEERSIRQTISELGLQQSLPSTQVLDTDRQQKVVWRTCVDGDMADVDIFLPAGNVSGTQDSIVYTMLFNCLTGGTQSFLERLLYYELGSVYKLESELLQWTNGGTMAFGYRTHVGQAEKTADRVHELLSNLPRHITREIVDHARALVWLEYVETKHNPRKAAHYYGEQLLLSKRFVSEEEYKAAVYNCSIEEVVHKAQETANAPTIVLKS